MQKKSKNPGLLENYETEKVIFLNKTRAAKKFEKTHTVKGNHDQQKLQGNGANIFQCMVRIQNQYPLYIRKISFLAEKIVHEIYKRAIRGRAIVTRTAVR